MLERILSRTNLLLAWMGYYAWSEYYRPLPGLDEWIRRRVRRCYIKQWPRPRTRIKKLIKLGSPKQQAMGVGLSSKGPWRLAKTFGSQSGLTNAYIKEQGLVSVRELRIAFHYPNG